MLPTWGDGWSVPLVYSRKGDCNMTTKVKIEIAQQHMPVVVEVLRSDGAVQHTSRLTDRGDAVEEYVHSGQTLRVREMTTQEIHNGR